jgi:hypothetical protein
VLANRGVEVVAGDLEDTTSLERVLVSVDAGEAPMPRMVLRHMPEEMSRMLFWIGDEGFQANVEAIRSTYPGLLSFEAWLKRPS